jgi:guanylate kinase
MSGPSGVGKDTLYRRLVEAHPDVFSRSVSHTTRGPRPGEEDGVHYNFVSHADFESLLAENGFVENAKFGGNRYGTSKKAIEDVMSGGKRVLLEIEMDGVKQVKQSGMDARYVFIAPPSMQILEDRLRGRKTETEDKINARIAQAKAEMEYAETGAHDKIIVNDDLDKAYEEFEAFVWEPTGQ